MNEIQLIEACKRKESFAQRLLYDQYVERMYLLCLRYVVHAVDAEEILSDAFLKCFRNINGFSYAGEGSTRAWLSKIVVNECLMFLRKKKQLVISIDEHRGIAETADDDNAISHLNTKDILRHIQQLPAGYRTVLNMYVFEDLSHKEIATMLNITENTSKSQLFKARALLKQRINDG